jgi:hypothetical protein
VSIWKLTHDTHPVSDDILNLSQNEVNNVERLMSKDVKKQ